MKTAKTSKRKAISKASGAPKSVEEYIALAPESARVVFQKLRETVRSAVPADAAETISYGIPAFKQKRVLVWLGAFADHCSLFPTAAVIEQFKSELAGFSTSKGTIHFPLDKPLPIALIKKIVKARVAQDAAKS